jgi:hypothetical protein
VNHLLPADDRIRDALAIGDVMDIHVATDGRIHRDIKPYARLTLEAAIRPSLARISRAEVRIVRYPDPALPQPVVARANLNVDGRLLQVHTLGTDTRRAVDDLGVAVHRALAEVPAR